MAGNNTSTLRVEVISSGISETSRALGGLGRSADTTEKKVAKLTDTISRLTSTHQSAIGAATGHNTVLAAIAQSLTTASAQAQSTARHVQNLTTQINSLTQSVGQSSEALRRKSHHAGTVEHTLKAMATAAATYVAFNLTRSIVSQADAWTMMNAKLKIFTGSQQNANAAQYELFEMAQKYRAPLEDMAKLYTRLATPMRQMGKSHEDTKEMVEGVTLALQLNGATAGEAASVMLQFSQAMSAGRLNGQEFNAVAENGSLILRALEEHTGKNAAELKKMGAEGTLTMDIIQEAIQKAIPKWRKDFESLPVTVDSALQKIKNAWMKAMGELNADTSFISVITSALAVLEEMIPKIQQELAGAFASVSRWLEENKGHLSQMLDQSTALIKDVWDLVGLFGFVAGAAAGAGEEISVIGFVLYSIRLIIAGIQDGFVFIGGVILKTGGFISKAIWEPLDRITTGALKKLLDGVSALFGMFAKGAGAVGLDRLSETMKAASASVTGVSKGLEAGNGFAIAAGRAMENAGDAALKMLANGEGAVAKVLAGEQAITKEYRKRDQYKPALPGGTPGNKGDEKAEAALKKALDKQVKAFEEHTKSLQTAVEEQEELKRRMLAFGLDFDKVGKGAKEEISIMYELNKLREGKIGKLEQERIKQLELLLVDARRLKAIEAENGRTKESLENEAKAIKSVEEKIEATKREADEMERKVATYGQLKGATEQLELTQLRERAHALAAIPEMQKHVELLNQLITQKERLANAKSNLGELEGADEAKKLLDKFLDGDKAAQFGSALKDAFGQGGEAIGNMIDKLDEFNRKQRAADETRAGLAKKLKVGTKEYEVAMKAANAQIEKNTINSYADMAGAMKGFFNEGSKGYKALEAVERAYRAYELAMTLETMFKKLFAIETVTAATVTGNAEKAASATASAGTEVAATMAVANANAVAGVANQANGDPYSAFPRMAAMAALMVGLGLAVSGGGKKSVDTAKVRQQAAGTGTVWGDENAKSESIAKSLALLSENSGIALRHSSAMLSALRGIEAALSGVTNTILMTNGIRGTRADIENLNLKTPRNFFSSLFGSSEKLLDMGIAGGTQRLEDIMTRGFQGQSYAEIEKKSKFLGLTTSTKTRTNYADLDPALEKQFTMLVGGLVDTVKVAAEGFGLSGEQVAATLDSISLRFGDMSFKGLSGKEIEEQLTAIFSSVGDQLSEAVLGGLQLEPFRKVGEGMLETAVRVAHGVEVAKTALKGLGVVSVEYQTLQDKQGDVAAAIVRESLMAAEAGTSLREVIKLLNGDVSELIQSYKGLVKIRDIMDAAGFNNDLSLDLLTGAGSIEDLLSGMNAYLDGFFSEAEAQAVRMSVLRKEFSRLGVTMPTTVAGFKSLVESLMSSGAEGEELAGRVLNLAAAFSDAVDSSDNVVSHYRDVVSEAYDREVEALENLRDKLKDFSESLKAFKESLIMGDMSPLSLAEKYATSAAKYESTVAKALSGDETAIAEFETVASEFLKLSREMYASGDTYMNDFNRVLRETTAVQEYAETQVTVAEASLAALRQQVETLILIDESVKTVAEAVQDLRAIMLAIADGDVAAIGAIINGSHANGLANVPYDGYIAELHKGERVLTADENSKYSMNYSQYGRASDEALVNEIKALRAEVQQLRTGQREQTEALVAANYDSNERNAQTIVDGVKNSASEAAYIERAKTNLV